MTSEWNIVLDGGVVVSVVLDEVDKHTLESAWGAWRAFADAASRPTGPNPRRIVTLSSRSGESVVDVGRMLALVSAHKPVTP